MMKKMMIGLMTLGLLVTAARSLEATVECTPNYTCYYFDSLKDVTSTNFFDYDGVTISGLVGSTVKSITILVTNTTPTYLKNVQEQCLKKALLAQVSPEKLQFFAQSTMNESSNSVTADLDQEIVFCSLISR